MKDAKGHGSNGRGGPGVKPIPNSPYHAKSGAELRYIIKDASEAAQASQSMGKLETKYNDQVNDAATVLGYRDRGGLSDHPVDVASRAAISNSSAKSDPVGTHDAMGGVGPNSPLVGSRDYDAFGRPRADKSSYDEASRDMALRSRNGQIGSGMKFRG